VTFKPNDLKEEDYVALQYVHPVLAGVLVLGMRRYMRMVPNAVRVTEGYRTEARAAFLAEQGKGIVQSLHCAGLAADLAILTPDRVNAIWSLRSYQDLNRCVQLAASEFGATVEWGGMFKRVDAVHFQLAGFAETGISDFIEAHLADLPELPSLDNVGRPLLLKPFKK